MSDEDVVTLALRTLALGADAATTATLRPSTSETTSRSPLAQSLSQVRAVGQPSFLPKLSVMPPGANIPGCDIEIHGLLGEGGMGRVLHGRQRSLRRDVALKTLRSDVDPRFSELLVSEGFLTGHLEHPNIVPVHLLGIDPETKLPLLVMKRVTGVPWTELLEDASHPLWARFSESPLETHLRILMSVADAVSFAHGKDVFHRDIKPENVMLGELGEVYLVDWGVATLSPGPWEATGKPSYVGTPCCMAPEIVDGSLPEGPWTDVYLLGATLHWILMSTPRHAGASVRDALASVVVSAPFPYPKSVPAELAELCRHSMAREPERRMRDAASFRRALADFLAHEGSNLVADAAEEKAREALALESDGDATRPKVARLRAEARFGFLLARREWAGSERAKSGLVHLLTAMGRADVAREDVQNARIVIDELKELAPAAAVPLDADLAVAERRVADREAEVLRLRAEAHANDLTVGTRARSRIFAMFATGTVFVSLVVAIRERGVNTVSPGFMVLSGAFFLLLSGVAFVKARTVLDLNAGSRALLSAFIAAIAGSFANRLLGYFSHQASAEILRADLLIGATSSLIVAIVAHMRGFYGYGVLMAASAALVTVYPARAAVVFPVTVLTVFVSAGVGSWRAARTPKP